MACIPSNMSKLGWDIVVVIGVLYFNAPVLFLQRNANQLLFELFTLVCKFFCTVLYFVLTGIILRLM